MSSQLESLILKHDLYDYISLNFSETEKFFCDVINNRLVIVTSLKTVDLVIDKIKTFLLKRFLFKLPHVLSIAYEFEQLKKSIEVSDFFNSVEGKRIHDELKQNGYEVETDWLIYNGYISIKSIIYKNYFYSVDPLKLREMGYGITCFKIRKFETFCGGVYTVGVHPNMRPSSGQFCFEEYSNPIPVNLQTMSLIKGVLSQINLSGAYNIKYHKNRLLKLISVK